MGSNGDLNLFLYSDISFRRIADSCWSCYRNFLMFIYLNTNLEIGVLDGKKRA